MKKLLPLLLCALFLASCGSSSKTVQETIDKKAEDLASLKGAKVESVTEADGTIALKVTFDSGILFGFNKSELEKEAKDQLERLIEGIEDMEDSRIRVCGHTDFVGNEAVNQAISTQRAQSVADYLIENGIDADRITVKGMSFHQPVADNSTEEGRAKNRRVEIYVIPAL